MNLLKFKSTPEMYEKEKSGRKPNTARVFPTFLSEKDAERFDLLEGWQQGHRNLQIQITNTRTAQSFKRKVTDVTYWQDIWLISWKHTK